MMKHIILFCAYLFSLSAFAQFSIQGGSGTPYEYRASEPKVYIVNKLSGAFLSYSHESENIVFYKYEQSPKDKVQIPNSEITTSISGGVTTYHILNLQDNRGYIAEGSGINLHSAWVIDYSLHPSSLTSITIRESTEDNKCDDVELLVEKSDDELYYIGLNEIREKIDRIYTLKYSTVEWKDNQFIQKLVNQETVLGKRIYVRALDDTDFTLEGDKIAKHFNQATEVKTGTHRATQIEVHIEASAVDEDGKEIILGTTEDAIGAPINIRFLGSANEPVASGYKWTVTNEKNPTDALLRYTADFDYTFTEAGKYTALLEVSNRNFECVESSSIEFRISESSLTIPNFFSPGNSTSGEENEWKVKYKSLIKFKCSIFNRWGNKVFEYTDPAKAWDGKYKGSLVSPGVYFYVIDAEGSDGIRYKKGGDINILYKK